MAHPIVSSKFDLLRWIQSEQGLADYVEWRNLPVTRLMIDGLAAMNAASRVAPSTVTDTIDPIKVVEENGFRAGRSSQINLLLNLDDFHMVSGGEKESTGRMLNYLIETEGFSEEQAKAALEAEQAEGEV